MTGLGHGLPEPPQIMMGVLDIIGRGRRIHHITAGIHMAGQALDGPAFSAGIPALKCQNHRNSFFIKSAVQQTDLFLQHVQFFLVLFFAVGKGQIYLA